MKKVNKKITPAFVTELSRCEIFVFGSNLAGHHGGGAARIAFDKFGAEWGNGVGPQGQSYAIPTMQGPVETIKPYVDDFIAYAKEHPLNRFLLTRVGCGIAGFTDEEIAPLFVEALNIPNISIPKVIKNTSSSCKQLELDLVLFIVQLGATGPPRYTLIFNKDTTFLSIYNYFKSF